MLVYRLLPRLSAILVTVGSSKIVGLIIGRLLKPQIHKVRVHKSTFLCAFSVICVHTNDKTGHGSTTEKANVYHTQIAFFAGLRATKRWSILSQQPYLAPYIYPCPPRPKCPTRDRRPLLTPPLRVLLVPWCYKIYKLAPPILLTLPSYPLFLMKFQTNAKCDQEHCRRTKNIVPYELMLTVLLHITIVSHHVNLYPS